MEKLKVKHDHKLTDIIKVGIFAIFLILPLLMFLPSCLYYGFNEHATAPTTTEENIELINFNQVFNYSNYFFATNGEIQLNATEFHYTYTSNNNNDDKAVSVNSGCNNLSHTYISKFYYKSNINFSFQGINSAVSLNATADYTLCTIIGTYESVSYGTYYWYNYSQVLDTWVLDVKNIQTFDLTKMFGKGNEPTLQEFNDIFTKEYYEYTQSKYMYINNGTTTEFIDISKNIYLAWQSIWKKPILEWTGVNNFKFTINAFTQVFGITEESYIANYINYLFTLMAIYIVFDVVIMVFTKLTHLLHE